SRDEPLTMNPEPRMRGWIWFPPHQDAEKVIQVTDDGRLALVGVKQRRTQDNPLFMLVLPNPRDKGLGLDLEELLKPDAFEKKERSRAQIAYAAEPDNFWVLAHGKLMRLGLLMSAKSGPKVQSGWDNGAISLGSPLHDSQMFKYPFESDAEPSPTLM